MQRTFISLQAQDELSIPENTMQIQKRFLWQRLLIWAFQHLQILEQVKGMNNGIRFIFTRCRVRVQLILSKKLFCPSPLAAHIFNFSNRAVLYRMFVLFLILHQAPLKSTAGCARVPNRFSCVQIFATQWTIAQQAPLAPGFPRQEYWSGLTFPCAEDLPDPEIEPVSLTQALASGDSLPLALPGKPSRGLGYSLFIYLSFHNHSWSLKPN